MQYTVPVLYNEKCYTFIHPPPNSSTPYNVCYCNVGNYAKLSFQSCLVAIVIF